MLHKLERELTEQGRAGVILGIFIVPGCPKNYGFNIIFKNAWQ